MVRNWYYLDSFAMHCGTRIWLRVHVVVLAVLIIVDRWWRWLLLLQELFAIEWACRIELEPGSYAIEIEIVVFVTG